MTIRLVPTSLLKRSVFALVAAVALISSAARLDAAAITFTFSSAPGDDGTLTYLSDPHGAQPAHDSFFGNIVSPQLGNGTLSVPSDFTNYITSTGHADFAIFTFANGTFFGSVDVALNLMTGTAMPTYHITDGTGAFAGVQGTVTETAQFTALGDFAQGIPARAAILSGGGTLTIVPEPGTIATLAIGLLACAIVHKRAH